MSDSYADFCAYDECDRGYDADLSDAQVEASWDAAHEFEDEARARVRQGTGHLTDDLNRIRSVKSDLARWRHGGRVAKSEAWDAHPLDALRHGRDLQTLGDTTQALVDIGLDGRDVSVRAACEAEDALRSLDWAHELVVARSSYAQALDANELERRTANALIQAGHAVAQLAETLADEGWWADEGLDEVPAHIFYAHGPSEAEVPRPSLEAELAQLRKGRRETRLALRRGSRDLVIKGLLRRQRINRHYIAPELTSKRVPDPPPAPPGRRVRANPRRTCAPPLLPTPGTSGGR